MEKLNDSLTPFIFENATIRGSIVHVNQTLKSALQHQDLPSNLKNVLGQLMAASALLASSIKMDGVLILQIQAEGDLKLLVVECDTDLKIRATAKWVGDIANTDFLTLIQNGYCLLTLHPKVGEPYQSIVPLEGNGIAEILENYMLRSQQIDTKLVLTSDGEQAAGMLLQKLPEQITVDGDAWNRVNHLASTLTVLELQNLPAQKLLTLLFSEEDIRLFDARSTTFFCGCTRQKVGNMLNILGVDEVTEMLNDLKQIEVNCDFCNKRYVFDAVDALEATKNSAAIKSTSTH
jgi:molecular chaperone Hsp33